MIRIGEFYTSWPLFLAFIFNLSILALTILGLVSLIVWIVRRLNRSGQGASTPLDNARERYARGEISKSEFEDIRKTIL